MFEPWSIEDFILEATQYSCELQWREAYGLSLVMPVGLSRWPAGLRPMWLEG